MAPSTVRSSCVRGPRQRPRRVRRAVVRIPAPRHGKALYLRGFSVLSLCFFAAWRCT